MQDDDVTTAKFHFVDLAGSERAGKTEAAGEQLQEGIKINQRWRLNLFSLFPFLFLSFPFLSFPCLSFPSLPLTDRMDLEADADSNHPTHPSFRIITMINYSI